MYKHINQGTCSTEILFEIEDERITSIEYKNGCPGNLLGIKSLVEGEHIDDVIARLEGIRCGRKNTSCPDQLTKALHKYKNGELEAI